MVVFVYQNCTINPPTELGDDSKAHIPNKKKELQKNPPTTHSYYSTTIKILKSCLIVRNNFYVCDIKIDISLGAAFLTVYKNEDVSLTTNLIRYARVCVLILYCENWIQQNRILGENEHQKKGQVFNKDVLAKLSLLIYLTSG